MYSLPDDAGDGGTKSECADTLLQQSRYAPFVDTP
jgi:hypothetical protein